MGGKAFKSTSDSAPIIDPELHELKEFVVDLFTEKGFKRNESFDFVGSAVDKPVCNDIDVAVVCESYEHRTAIIGMLCELFDKRNVRCHGDIASVCLLKDRLSFLHADRQLDVVLCDSLKTTKWLMRGFWRHMWFSWLAKIMTEKTSGKEKFTIVPSRGLKIVTARNECELNEVQYIYEPEKIVNKLRAGVIPDANFDDDVYFWMLQSSFRSDVKDPLGGFLNYIDRFKDRKGYDDISQEILKSC